LVIHHDNRIVIGLDRRERDIGSCCGIADDFDIGAEGCRRGRMHLAIVGEADDECGDDENTDDDIDEESSFHAVEE